MIDDQIKGVLLAVILLLGLVGAGQYYYSHLIQEPFSELGTLGPSIKIGDYPTQVVAGQNFTLYLYVGNHEGHVEYYEVLVKLGNASNVNINESLPVPPLYTFGMVLVNNQTYLQPITISIPHPGINVRLVLELWQFNTTVNAFTYTGISNQLWMNVTAPLT
ncbi:MAG: DUF1616 domain-containing protein [Conexivisphaerales archaeon]